MAAIAILSLISSLVCLGIGFKIEQEHPKGSFALILSGFALYILTFFLLL